MRGLIAILGLAAALSTGAFAEPVRPAVTYTLSPVMTQHALATLHVEIAFRGAETGETQLALPNSFSGQDELWRGIVNLHVISGAQMSDGDGPAARVLRHRPGAAIRIAYDLAQSSEDPVESSHNPYRPIVRPTYFHLIGQGAIVIPMLDGSSPVRVEAHGFPTAWTFVSNMQESGYTLDYAQQSVIVGGDFRVLDAGGGVRVAIRGRWPFSDQNIISNLSSIVRVERSFWSDSPSQFLVTVLPFTQRNPQSNTTGGTGFRHAFAFFSTPNAALTTIQHVLAHENLHTWIPGQLGGMAEHDEATDYWFSEGFTDFYMARLLLRQNIWSLQDFADDWNTTLSAYAHSPVRTAPNARIVADMWNDSNVHDLPYQRGRFLAAIWDARLRASGHSLDGVMREMRVRASDHATAAMLFPTVAATAGVSVSADIANFVVSGAPMLLPADVFEPCGRIDTRQVPNFDRGFDITATQANHNIIAGVDPALPAYAAGLRNGMVLEHRTAGTIGDAEHEIAYLVRDGAAERTINYMPRGRGDFPLQTFVLDPHLDGDRLAQCRAALVGA